MMLADLDDTVHLRRLSRFEVFKTDKRSNNGSLVNRLYVSKTFSVFGVEFLINKQNKLVLIRR